MMNFRCNDKNCYICELEAKIAELESANELYAAEMSAAKEAGFYSAQELFMAYKNLESALFAESEKKQELEKERDGLQNDMAQIGKKHLALAAKFVELEEKIRKMRPYNGRAMSVQEVEEWSATEAAAFIPSVYDYAAGKEKEIWALKTKLTSAKAVIEKCSDGLIRLMNFTPRQVWVGGELGGWCPNEEAILSAIENADGSLAAIEEWEKEQ